MAEYVQILDNWNRKLRDNNVFTERKDPHAGQCCSGLMSSGAGTGNWWRQ